MQELTLEAITAWRRGDADTLGRELKLSVLDVNPIKAGGRCDYPKTSLGRQAWDRARQLRQQLDEAVMDQDNA